MRAILTLIAASLLHILLTSCAAVSTPERPRLIVVISYDQLRGDLIQRTLPFMGTEGFARIIREGARYDSCYYDHANNLTGPGHAVIMTGCYPYRTGITTNQLCDRDEGTCFYCAGDAKGVLGPHALLVPTVGDKLIDADPTSKVVSVSLKDRAAILMGGHQPTACIWLDHASLSYVTSPAYPTPPWLADINAAHPISAYTGKVWEATIPDGQGAFDDAPWEFPLSYGRRTFPYTLPKKADADFVRDVLRNAYSVENLFNVATDLVAREQLGRDDHPDILTIGVSTTDYVGHSFGPDSREVQELLVQCDKTLASFITMLDNKVGRKNYALIITSDHGVAPVPEALVANRAPDEPLLDAGRIRKGEVARFVDSTLTFTYGDPSPRSWFKKVYIPDFYLDEETAQQANVSVDDLAATAAHALRTLYGVELAFTRSDVLNNAIPAPPDVAALIKRSFHPLRSGDVMVYPRRYWVLNDEPGDHRTYHDYDRWVELSILGPAGTGRGRKGQKVSPADIAPTIATWLGIDLGPVDGKPLPTN